MTHNPYAPLVSQFRSETDAGGTFRRLVSKLFGSVGSRERSRNVQPDGLAMLQREVDRIRLQSRHWLM
jgi:hypothetical protein